MYNYFKNVVENTICTLNSKENDLSNIKLNPNPTSNIVSIEGFDISIPFDVSVFNSLGQLCLSKMNQQRIDVSSLSDGLYFLKVTQEN